MGESTTAIQKGLTWIAMIDARWARTEMLSVEIDLLVERARHKAPTSSLLNLKSCSRKSSSTQPASQGREGHELIIGEGEHTHRTSSVRDVWLPRASISRVIGRAAIPQYCFVTQASRVQLSGGYCWEILRCVGGSRVNEYTYQEMQLAERRVGNQQLGDVAHDSWIEGYLLTQVICE